MAGGVITAYEFDRLLQGTPGGGDEAGIASVPRPMFEWLERQCFLEGRTTPWIRPARWRGQRALQLTSHVGVIQSPDGTRLEILPKAARGMGGAAEARRLLVAMLRCLPEFRHLRAGQADQLAVRMPLPEVFIAEFLARVKDVVKRGLRGDYIAREANLDALRGKLLVSEQLRRNSLRLDRFFTAHDEFSIDRAENRLLHAGLQRVLQQSTSRKNQQLARELAFAFADVPASKVPASDLARTRIERGMVFYGEALAWVRLILEGRSPVPGCGSNPAPALLFPMDALFEAFVARHLAKQLPQGVRLSAQYQGECLASCEGAPYLRLRPDLLLRRGPDVCMVLDTKWKLLDTSAGATGGSGLSAADFYQLNAYGQAYLQGRGEMALVHPMTEAFSAPLEFQLTHSPELRLWVLPFCLVTARLRLPERLASALGWADQNAQVSSSATRPSARLASPTDSATTSL